MPRPKGSKKEKNQPLLPVQLTPNDDLNWISTSIGRAKKSDYDEEIIPTNEINGGRVVVNPAVLRYLEQNRNKCVMSMDINEGLQESMVFSHEQCVEFVDDEQETCSTECLTSVRLAEWILSHQQCAKLQ